MILCTKSPHLDSADKYVGLVYHWRELPQVPFLSWQTRVLSRQNTSFVATKHVFCRDKSMLAATKVLSRQKFCRGKHPARILLLRQKTSSKDVIQRRLLSRQTRVCCDKRRRLSREMCRDKSFVATKMILMAAPANDTSVARRITSVACYTHTHSPLSTPSNNTQYVWFRESYSGQKLIWKAAIPLVTDTCHWT